MAVFTFLLMLQWGVEARFLPEQSTDSSVIALRCTDYSDSHDCYNFRKSGLCKYLKRTAVCIKLKHVDTYQVHTKKRVHNELERKSVCKSHTSWNNQVTRSATQSTDSFHLWCGSCHGSVEADLRPQCSRGPQIDSLDCFLVWKRLSHFNQS